MMKLIAPSILSADFAKLGDEIKAVEAAGADWIHADVMDGHFVPNITIGPLVVEAVKRVTTLPIDVHLMIENPDNYIAAFAAAGASYISVQVETCSHLNRTVQLIKDCGAQAGVVLNPSTPVASLEWILEYVDYILIMSVNPGFGGQAFIPNSINKIKALRNHIQERGLSVLIEVDGGVNEKTIAQVAAAGADVFVAGSAIFGSKDYQTTIQSLRQKNRRHVGIKKGRVHLTLPCLVMCRSALAYQSIRTLSCLKTHYTICRPEPNRGAVPWIGDVPFRYGVLHRLL
jgi:ribulose-phosphate 3-epimerase